MLRGPDLEYGDGAGGTRWPARETSRRTVRADGWDVGADVRHGGVHAGADSLLVHRARVALHPAVLWRSRIHPGRHAQPDGRFVCGYYVHCFGGTTDACAVDTAIEPWTLITIPRPSGISSARAHDVNDAGQVVSTMGGSIGDFGFIYHLWTGNLTLIPSGVPDGACSISAINSNGTVCGTRSIVGAPSYATNAFIWSPQGGIVDLGVMNGPRSGATDINDSNVVTGWTGNDIGSPNSRGFVLADGQLTIFGAIPNGSNSWARGLNNAGEFVLSGFLNGGGSRGYLWSRNTLTELPPLPGYMSSNGTCTNALLVYGGSGTGSNHVTCFWQNLVPFNAEQLILTPGYDNFGLAVAVDSLNIAGTAQNAQNQTLTIYLVPNFTIVGDATCDGTVDVTDLYQVITDWGTCGACRTDFNNDGIVNVPDLLFVIDNWTFSK